MYVGNYSYLCTRIAPYMPERVVLVVGIFLVQRLTTSERFLASIVSFGHFQTSFRLSVNGVDSKQLSGLTVG